MEPINWFWNHLNGGLINIDPGSKTWFRLGSIKIRPELEIGPGRIFVSLEKWKLFQDQYKLIHHFSFFIVQPPEGRSCHVAR